MKKLVLSAMLLTLGGCGSAPEPTGDMSADLKTLYDVKEVETLGQQLVITMPLSDATSEADMVFKSFNNMGDSLNYIMSQHPDIEAQKIYYMYRADLTDNTGSASRENLMGVIFNANDLKRVYQGEYLPFQAYLPYADMDYKQTLGKEAVQSWCAEQDDKADYTNVCL